MRFKGETPLPMETTCGNITLRYVHDVVLGGIALGSGREMA